MPIAQTFTFFIDCPHPIFAVPLAAQFVIITFQSLTFCLFDDCRSYSPEVQQLCNIFGSPVPGIKPYFIYRDMDTAVCCILCV